MSDAVVGLARAVARSPGCSTLRVWHALASGAWTFPQYLDEQRRNATLLYLTIDTTRACDLTCPGMCYYHPDIAVRGPTLDPVRFEQAIRDAHQHLGLRNLVFAGKEPLLNAPLLFRLLGTARDLPAPRLDTGIVTNGRHIASAWNQLRHAADSAALTFLDISLDSGDSLQHDRIRGVRGTFDVAWAALERSSRELVGVRVGAASVLRHDNGEGILRLIHRAARWNSHFFVTPIQPAAFTSTPPLRWSVIAEFLDALHALLSGSLAGANLEIMVSLLGIYLESAARDGFLNWEDFQEDAQGQCYVEHRPGHNRLIVHAQVLPETAIRVARLTPSGAYLPNAHFLQDVQPERFAIGNIVDHSLIDLHRQAAADGSILQQMVASRHQHACRNRECWSSCFGGLVASEHAFVEGRPLTIQPRLCLKVFDDNDSEPQNEMRSMR